MLGMSLVSELYSHVDLVISFSQSSRYNVFLFLLLLFLLLL